MKSQDLLGLVNAFSRTAIVIPILLLVCVVGEMVTTAYGDLNETVYGLSWHLWPIKLQKNILPILIRTQKPVVFKGLFTLDCSRDTFKRVMRKILYISSNGIEYFIEKFRFFSGHQYRIYGLYDTSSSQLVTHLRNNRDPNGV